MNLPSPEVTVVPTQSITKNADEPITSDGGKGFDGDSGDGFGGGGGPDPEPERTPPPEGYRIGIRMTIVSITILFLTLTSAYIFNRAKTYPIIMPPTVWLSTGLIIASSLTMEFAKRSLRKRQESGFRFWILVTMTFGSGFLIAQLLVWRQLRDNGFYITGNFHSGYAYIFTALHGVHLIGGLMVLAYVILRDRTKWTAVRRRVSVDATALYWHFLDGLWIYLLILLFFWK